MRTSHVLSARNVLVAFVIAGAIAAAACADPPSKGNNGAQSQPRSKILLPNIDDDNGDGIPDVNGAPLPAGTDDEMLQIQVFPDGTLPQGAMVRAEIAEPWTRFARAFIGISSPDGSRFVPPPVEVKPVESRRRGSSSGSKPPISRPRIARRGRSEGHVRNEGGAAASRRNGPVRRGAVPAVLLP